ncbi:MAG: BspA family leucine-rich repeat surface protein [Acholeplasmataceae bacterium]|jgi:surface protein|nr:BspA family leucine-rich repeat surface protein [Acholeplasmataceae bacterium]
MNKKTRFISLIMVLLFSFLLISCSGDNNLLAKKHSVIFYDYDKTILKEEKVEKSQSATPPANPIREGYDFIGWDKEFDNITSKLEVNALYEIRSYLVVFKDYEGTVVKEEIVEHFKSATPPDIPPQEDYDFIGWDREFDNVTSDLEISPRQEIKSYRVVFKDYDGKVLKEETIKRYQAATAPTNPTREGYQFSGWNQKFNNITSNLEISALYKKTYKVTWTDDDGTILAEECVVEGVKPKYKGVLPSIRNAEIVQAFKKWNQEIIPITKDTVYKAVMTEALPAKYEIASDQDFITNYFGDIIYVGDAEFVIIPEYIKETKLISTQGKSSHLFEQRPNIKGVYFVGSKNIIEMSKLFKNNESEDLELQYLDTSNVKEMVSMFEHSQATTLDLSLFDTSNVTNMEAMFAFSQATALDLSSFDTRNVKDMTSMFENSQATTIDLSSFKTSKVESMGWMFSRSKAETLDLSFFDTSNVTNMFMMFSESKAKSINLSSFKTNKVENMGLMFADTQITTLDLSNFETSNVKDMAAMFASSQITRLDLSSFDTSNVIDMNGMFAYSQATTLDLSSFNTSKVTNMAYMFTYSQVTTLDLSNFETSNVMDMFEMFSYSEAISLDLSSFDTGNVTNMSHMFTYSKATEIDLSSFNTSKVINMSGMFYNSKATTLDLSSFDTSKVKEMDSMFANCEAIVLDLSSFDMTSVESMESFLVNANVQLGYARTEADKDILNEQLDVFILKES